MLKIKFLGTKSDIIEWGQVKAFYREYGLFFRNKLFLKFNPFPPIAFKEAGGNPYVSKYLLFYKKMKMNEWEKLERMDV